MLLNPKPRREVKAGVAKQEYDFTLNLERVACTGKAPGLLGHPIVSPSKLIIYQPLLYYKHYSKSIVPTKVKAIRTKKIEVRERL